MVLEGLAAMDDLFLVVDTATGLRTDIPSLWQWHLGEFLTEMSNRMSPGSAALILNEVRTRRSTNPSKMFASGTVSAAHRVAGVFDTRLELIRVSVTEEEYNLVVHVMASPNRPPRQHVSLPARKGHGVDVVRSLVDIALYMEVLSLRGVWVYFGQTRLGAGTRSAADALRSDEMSSTLDQLYAKVQGLVSGSEQPL